jgi:hypothetical protein
VSFNKWVKTGSEVSPFRKGVELWVLDIPRKGLGTVYGWKTEWSWNVKIRGSYGRFLPSSLGFYSGEAETRGEAKREAMEVLEAVDEF